MSLETLKLSRAGVAVAPATNVEFCEGFAVIVLGTLETLDVNTGISMLGMGLTALALASFQE